MNPVSTNPDKFPTLKELCASCILFHHRDSQFGEYEDSFFNEMVLEKLWHALKSDVPPGALGLQREVYLIEIAHPCGTKVSKLFRELIKALSPNFTEGGVALGNRVPIERLGFVQLQETLTKKWEDEALVILLNACLQNDPQWTLGECKTWLEDPANVATLANVHPAWNFQREPDHPLIRAIPPQIEYTSQLTLLNFNGHQISHIPASLCTLTQLMYLSLESNRIFNLPEEFGSLKQLLGLCFNDNSLRFIPECISKLDKLQEFSIFGNSISSIPDWLGSLTQLQKIDFGQNRISYIPPSFCTLTQLIQLALGGNQISSLPEEFQCLNSLQELYLDYNSLPFIPECIGKLDRLQVFTVANNRISFIPNWLGSLTQLQRINFGQNRIYYIPPSFCTLTQLAELSLDSNQIFSLPEEFKSLNSLQYLYLNHNPLTFIPNCISKLDGLQIFAIANNRISFIPDWLGSLTQLQKIDFSQNRITFIPDSLSQLNALEHLALCENKISTIPNSLGNLSKLQCLNLSHNQIVSLPDCLRYLVRRQLLQTCKETAISCYRNIIGLNRLQNIPEDEWFVPPPLPTSPDHWGHLIALKEIGLEGNPLLFIAENDKPLGRGFIAIKGEGILAKLDLFCNHECTSTLAKFFKSWTLNELGQEQLGEAFALLSRQDQCLIFEMVYLESGIPSEDSEWGEHHCFDDIPLFSRALRRAISTKFECLSQERKNRVFEEIYHLVKPETEDEKWGEHHVFDNVLRLIDAMDRVL